MSNKIDQKAYLQKYLSGSSGDKKKKKKKATKGKGFKIIDDDIDLSKLRPLDFDELDILGEGEDAPQVAGIIDDRPEELKQLEALKTSSKWKVVSQDDGFNSKLKVEEIKRDIKETEKDNELIFGKMYSDSEDEKNNDSDASPPRKQTNDNQKSSKPSKKHDSDSDFSPPRKQNGNHSNNNDSDVSAPRSNKSKEKVRKPSRWGSKEEVSQQSPPRSRKDSRRRQSQSSDVSPPRKSKKYDSDQSPPRSKKDMHRRRSQSSDISPPRKPNKPENSPQRKSKKKYDSDQSPSRKSRQGHAPRSPVRKSTIDKRKDNSQESYSPSKRRKYSPHEQSSSRKTQYDNNHRQEHSKKRRTSYDSDQSPPRKIKKSPERNKRKYNSDSDQSPPRRVLNSDRDRRNNDSPPPTNKKMARTLEGKLAGLQDAKQLREENDDFRRRENELFNKMSDEVSGRNAKAVSRKGKRETSEERQKQKEKAERQKEINEKYKKWSRGLKQLQDQEARVEEFMHEASKPLARHKGDKDLESNLKQIERAGDPMLKYIREKKRERGELGPEKPSYKGSFPPNRFNIRPGYRWDGVDRSNGYEKKFFDQQSKRKAQEEEAYKWSTEDL